MRGLIGLGAALALAGSIAPYDFRGWPDDDLDRRPARRQRPPREPAPNDIGPVFDSTPESKRARRRRLARERKP